MNIERPLDMLNALKGKEVLITMKEGDTITGTLLAFDIHINIVINGKDDDPKIKERKNIFVRGDTVVFVEGA